MLMDRATYVDLSHNSLESLLKKYEERIPTREEKIAVSSLQQIRDTLCKYYLTKVDVTNYLKNRKEEPICTNCKSTKKIFTDQLEKEREGHRATLNEKLDLEVSTYALQQKLERLEQWQRDVVYSKDWQSNSEVSHLTYEQRNRLTDQLTTHEKIQLITSKPMTQVGHHDNKRTRSSWHSNK